VSIMIHSQAGTRAVRNGVLKKYVGAVLIGFLLGGVYAVAEKPAESQALSPKQPVLQHSHYVKPLSAGKDCGAQVDIQIAAVVVAPPRSRFGGSDRYAEAGAADVRETDCTWAI